MLTGLSINQKADADVIIPDFNVRHSLSLRRRKKKIKLDCHFYKKNNLIQLSLLKKEVTH